MNPLKMIANLLGITPEKLTEITENLEKVPGEIGTRVTEMREQIDLVKAKVDSLQMGLEALENKIDVLTELMK